MYIVPYRTVPIVFPAKLAFFACKTTQSAQLEDVRSVQQPANKIVSNAVPMELASLVNLDISSTMESVYVPSKIV